MTGSEAVASVSGLDPAQRASVVAQARMGNAQAAASLLVMGLVDQCGGDQDKKAAVAEFLDNVTINVEVV